MRSRDEPLETGLERELRRRLYGELEGAYVPAAPVEAVLKQGRALRARRRLRAVSVLAAASALGTGLALASPGAPRPTHAGAAITLNMPDPRAPRGVFASGTARGRPWHLAVRDVADPGSRCMAAVMVNGRDGDLLPPRSSARRASAISDVALLQDDPGQKAAGFAFLQVRPGVTRIVAHLVDGTTLPVHPVTVTRCGQRYRLAGFAYPLRGIRRITAYSGAGLRGSYVPPPGMFAPGILPPGLFFPGLWSNSWPAGEVTASGRVGAGLVGDLAWAVTVSLGSDGECYRGAVQSTGPPPATGAIHSMAASPGRSAAGPSTAVSGDGARSHAVAGGSKVVRSSIECGPLEEPPASATLRWLPIYSLTTREMTGYAGTVSPRTAFLVAELANGSRLRVRPAVIAGRKYFAVVIRQGSRVVRLISYGSDGRVIASIASFPTPG